jgi:molybdopterin-guanine dinucleotide biosynthesis protein A
MKKHLENNKLSIADCLNEMHVRYLNQNEFSKFDPEFHSFFNVNNQTDIDLLTKIEGGKPTN